MNEKVLEVISQIANIDISVLKSNLNTEKLWESIVFIEIIIALEEEFDVRFSQDEIASMTTPQSICQLVAAKSGNE